MAEIKTKLTNAHAKDFLKSIKDEQVRNDCLKIVALMEKATKAKAKMWGDKIIGCGIQTLKSSDGTERKWMRIAFSPRKQNITIYLPNFKGRKELLGKMGKCKSTQACLHIKRLSDVNLPILSKLINEAIKHKPCGW
jgi:hypothetical protein